VLETNHTVTSVLISAKQKTYPVTNAHSAEDFSENPQSKDTLRVSPKNAGWVTYHHVFNLFILVEAHKYPYYYPSGISSKSCEPIGDSLTFVKTPYEFPRRMPTVTEVTVS
jgi:hypothetical protein